MREAGRIYYRQHVNPAWIMMAAGLCAAGFEAYASQLHPIHYGTLATTLHKRLRRLEVWQMEGYHQASEARLCRWMHIHSAIPALGLRASQL